MLQRPVIRLNSCRHQRLHDIIFRQRPLKAIHTVIAGQNEAGRDIKSGAEQSGVCHIDFKSSGIGKGR